MKIEQKIIMKRINDLCKKEGISYYTLSDKSGVPMSTLMHLVNGTVKNPGIFTIVRICNGFGITLAEFFDTEAFHSMVKGANIEG